MNAYVSNFGSQVEHLILVFKNTKKVDLRKQNLPIYLYQNGWTWHKVFFIAFG